MTEKVIAEFPNLSERATGFGFPPPPAWLELKLKAKYPEITQVGLRAASLAYLHVKQAHETAKNCKRDPDQGCFIRRLVESPQSEILGFSGYHEREAQFNYLLYHVKDGKLQIIK
jgi:hypothetical protein